MEKLIANKKALESQQKECNAIKKEYKEQNVKTEKAVAALVEAQEAYDTELEKLTSLKDEGAKLLSQTLLITARKDLDKAQTNYDTQKSKMNESHRKKLAKQIDITKLQSEINESVREMS